MQIVTSPGDLGLPLAAESAFGRNAGLIVEVGFGDGRYLTHLAREFPESNLLGVEISMGSVWRAYRRMLRESITNVRLIRADARFVVRDVVAPRSLERIYVNFPDPWPRKKHLKNRLLQAPFFTLLSTRLADSGMLLLTTDHGEYFEFAMAEAASTGLYEIVPGSPPEATLRTKYAEKWQEMHKEIFHAEFRKKGEAEPIPHIITTIEMQHAILDGDLSSVSSFAKKIHPYDGGHVIVLEGFRDLNDAGLIFKVRVEEADLKQEILVQAWQKDEGVFVSLQPFGDPLATRGVREAVHAVTALLESHGLSVRERWI